MKALKTLCMLLFLSQTTWALQADDTPKQAPSHQADYASWFNQLNQHLIESENNYEVAMGVAALLNGVLTQLEQKQTEAAILLPQLTNILNELIAQPELSNATLDLLTVWCFKPAIQHNCDQSTLLDKHMQQQKSNLNVYFKSLQIAVEQNHSELAHQTMRLMAMAAYSHTSHNTTEAFNATLDAYIDQNPLPKSYIQAMLDDSSMMLAASANDQNHPEQMIQQFARTAIKSAYALFFEPPNVQPLYFICKSNPALASECLSITEVLINNSNMLSSKGMGYAILMGMYEGKSTELFNSYKSKQEQYREQLKCLKQATQSPNPIHEIFDPKYQRIQLKNIGEMEKVQQLGHYVYNKYKKDNPEQINPDSCMKSEKTKT